MGTLLRLDRPIERLRGSLSARGIAISEEQAVAALTAEVREYRAGHLTGVDHASVMALRHRCADVFREQLPSSLDHDRAYSVLMSLLRFQVLPGSTQALARLHDAGIGLAVVSNWDTSLEGAMLAVGLRGSFDVVVSSASVGAAKPDPAALQRALELLGVEATAAVMVGDHAVDVEAAASLGMPCAQVVPGAGITEAVDAILNLPL
jgi:HAD superfamily hydrolase (TIGR01509 family)